MSFKQVAEALSAGADPGMLCATCPWDRYCIEPPSMTKAEVDAQIERSQEEDAEKIRVAEQNGEKASIPLGGILTALMVSGKDQAATICPVFAMRLRSSAGRGIVDAMKSQMGSWDDQS